MSPPARASPDALWIACWARPFLAGRRRANITLLTREGKRHGAQTSPATLNGSHTEAQPARGKKQHPKPAVPREHGRFDYSATVDRPPLRWPNDARVALWVIPNIRHCRFDRPAPLLARDHPHNRTAANSIAPMRDGSTAG